MDDARGWLVLLLGAAVVAFVASRTERGARAASVALEEVTVTAQKVGAAIVNALTPRGIRNNNPGNIEWIADPAKRWLGMVGLDGRYGVFDTAAHGVRAIGGELRANFRRGQNTIADIIGEWAPPGENDTAAYEDAVALELGVNADTPLSASLIPNIAAAIIRHENGVQPYAFADLAQWVQA